MPGDMKKDLAEIAFILDRSGSMASVTEAAITGFNEFLRDQQKVERRARLTLVLFDNEYGVGSLLPSVGVGASGRGKGKSQRIEAGSE